MNSLKKQGHDTDILWNDIKEIVIKTLMCGQPELSHQYRAA